jgi:acetoin utilization deacetylase AcuC-like enzyme
VSLPIVRGAAYDAPLPDGHRFPMAKFAALADHLIARGLGPEGFIAPVPARRDQLIAAHEPAYVDAVLSLTLPAEAQRRIGLPVTADVVRRSLHAVGGTIRAAELALEQGLAANAAGGSHHAGPSGGAGFCVFNDVAVAALDLLARGAIGQALVIDLDVHQGDGTAAIFADDSRVFTVSVHGETNFPARKAASDIDIGLPRGAEDAVYLQAVAGALAAAFARCAPDLVFFNAGIDPHTDDALGHLRVSDAGLAARDGLVFDAAQARGLPLVIVAGGGYGADAALIAGRHADVIARAAARFADWPRRL